MITILNDKEHENRRGDIALNIKLRRVGSAS